MISRNLTRRLERLESRIQPIVGEPRIMTIEFVDKDRKVVDRREITLAAPALHAGQPP
jgi:hypothetical protein